MLDAEASEDCTARIVWCGLDISGKVNKAIVRDSSGRLGLALLKLLWITKRRTLRMCWVPAFVRWFPRKTAMDNALKG